MANPSPPLKHLVDLTVHERHLIELNPNRKVATKGGSMPGIFHRWVPLGHLPGASPFYWPGFALSVLLVTSSSFSTSGIFAGRKGLLRM